MQKRDILKIWAVLIICLLLLAIPVLAQSDPEFVETFESDPVITPPARSTSFTCGVMQSGSFGGMLETHSYTVYLQANKTVAFMSTGMVSSMTVFSPNGYVLGAVPVVASSSLAKYAALTTTQTGWHTINVSGMGGSYTMNCLTGQGTTANTNTGYSRSNAAAYAAQYWNTPNTSDYPYYSADCTNFVSQCVYAGGMPMINGSGTDAHWFVTSNSHSPSWTGADYFMRHWTKVRLSSYNGRAYSVKIFTKDYVLNNWSTFYNAVGVGDIVQYLQGSDSNAFHSTIAAAKIPSTQTINFYAHSSVQNSGSMQNYISNQVTNTMWIVVIRISSN